MLCTRLYRSNFVCTALQLIRQEGEACHLHTSDMPGCGLTGAGGMVLLTMTVRTGGLGSGIMGFQLFL